MEGLETVIESLISGKSFLEDFSISYSEFQYLIDLLCSDVAAVCVVERVAQCVEDLSAAEAQSLQDVLEVHLDVDDLLVKATVISLIDLSIVQSSVSLGFPFPFLAFLRLVNTLFRSLLVSLTECIY